MQRTHDGWKPEQAMCWGLEREEAWYQVTLGKNQCKVLPSGVLWFRCEPYPKSSSNYKVITFPSAGGWGISAHTHKVSKAAPRFQREHPPTQVRRGLCNISRAVVSVSLGETIKHPPCLHICQERGNSRHMRA